MLEADVLGSYYVARPMGLVDSANLAIERRLFGSIEAGVPPEFLPASVTGQWRNWASPEWFRTADQAYDWASIQGYTLYGPNRDLPDPPGRLSTPEDGGILTVGHGDINSFPIGEPSDPATGFTGDPHTRLLWTIDDRGVNFMLEDQPWDSGRGTPTHTNMSAQAYAAGEAWRTGPNRITVSAASRAFGFNDRLSPELFAEATARYEAAVRVMRSLGLDVTALPFGQR